MTEFLKYAELTSGLLEAIIWSKVAELFLIKKYNKYVHAISITILWILFSIRSIAGWYNTRPVIDFVMFGGCILYIFAATIILYKSRLKYKCFVSFLYISITSVLDLLLINGVLLFIPDLTVGSFAQLTVYHVCVKILKICLLFLLIEYSSYKRIKLHMVEKLFSNIVLLIFFINYILLLSLYITFNNTQCLTREMSLYFVSISLFLILLFFIIFISKLIKSLKRVSEEKLKYQNMQLKYKSNEDMNLIANNLRKLKDDMNNHIAVMYGLTYTKQYESLQNYILELYENMPYANDLITTNNETLSIILNAKKTLAHEKGINLNCLVMIDDLKLSNVETCSLFGNIIDNALEVVENVESRKVVKVELIEDRKGWHLCCQNPYREKPIIIDNQLVTSKTDKEVHGFSNKNVRDIIERYNGSLSNEITNSTFKVVAFIPR